MLTTTFTEADFWKAFVADLKQARFRVLIQSPFITVRRLKILASDFASLTRRNIAICIFVQEPRNLNIDPEFLDPESFGRLQEFRAGIAMLESIGAHVTLRQGIHAKLAIIDEKVLWEGSLNILSFANTKEHMRRWESKTQAIELITKHTLNDCLYCQVDCSQFGSGPPHPLQLARIGSVLNKQRERLKLSQRNVGAKCGFSAGRMSQIESGTNITLSTLLQVSNELGLQIVLVPNLLCPAVTQTIKQLVSLEPEEETVSKPQHKQRRQHLPIRAPR